MTYPFIIHLAYRPQKPPELWFPLRQRLAVQGIAFGRGESPGVRHQSIDCLRRFHHVSGRPSPIARSFGGCGGFTTTLDSAISSSAPWAEVGLQRSMSEIQRIQRTQSLKWYLLASHFVKSFSAEKSDFKMFFCCFFFFSIADSANSAFHVDLGLSENRAMQNRIASPFSAPFHREQASAARYVCSYDLDDGSKAKLRPILPEDEGGMSPS